MENYLFGCISGMFGVTISHPFDTIKTCIQTNNKIQLNPRFLYRGLQYPLIGVGLEKAIVFGTFTNAVKHSSSINNDYYKYIFCGAFAGLAASLIVTPIERLKILWQLKEKGKNYNMKEIMNANSLFKGLSATFTRETPGFAIYFSVYEYIKKRWYNNNISPIGSFLAGGFSGLIAWIFIYPQDCIKTMIQSKEKEQITFRKGFSIILKEGGITQFYKGFHFAVMRAIPLHAGTFFCFELLTNYFYMLEYNIL
jgi:solute carrier family 25 carnitine/acylcarnitine transporter 20/29